MATSRKPPPRRDEPPATPGLVPNLDQGLGYLLRVPAHIRRMTSPMLRVRHFVQFMLERLILRGAIARLLVIAAAIALVAATGGVLAYLLTGAFDSPLASIWWAFLRITDPGYLGDDEGTWLRVISVTMTVGGLVLLLGALIAIMTQWLNQTIEELEQGLSPIVMKHHVLVLGWSRRTPAIVEQLVSSEGRVQRFLDTFGGRRLKIVILVEAIGPALVQELKDRLGPYWRPGQVILRSGSAVRLEHLERVDFRHAAVVVLAAEATRGGDETVIKTLTTAATAPVGPWPLVVAEILEPDHLTAGVKAYPGPAEIIPTGLLSSRALMQTARYPGVGRVVEDLFDQDGVQVFLHDTVTQTGIALADLMYCFDSGVPLGVVRASPREFVPLLAPGARVEAGDLVAVLGHDFESSRPRGNPGPDTGTPRPPPRPRAAVPRRRMLIVGWNNTVPSLLAECDGYAEEFSAVDVASLMPAAERERVLARKNIALTHIEHRQLECDITTRAELERLEPAAYDVIMLVPSDWRGSAEQADARNLLGYLMLEELLALAPRRPHVIVEAMDEASAALFTGPDVELMVTPKLRSHILAQVALRRDLNTVFEHLLGVGGAEISLRESGPFAALADFYALQQRLARDGQIALGVLRADGVSDLNPPKRAPLALAPGDRVVVLTLAI